MRKQSHINAHVATCEPLPGLLCLALEIGVVSESALGFGIWPHSGSSSNLSPDECSQGKQCEPPGWGKRRLAKEGVSKEE